MSHLAFTLQACPNLQDALVNYFATCSNFGEPIPFMEFLGSSINRSGLTQTIAPGGGKVKTIELTYTQRMTEDLVAADQPNPTCVATNEWGNLKTNYTIDPNENLQVNQYIDPVDLETICQSNPMYFIEKLNAMVDVLDRALATKHSTDAFDLYGNWASDVSPVIADELIVKTEKDSSTDIYPYTMEDIDFAATQTGFCGQRLIFAGSDLYKYYRRIQAGCCSNEGIDLSSILRQYGTAVMYDQRIATAFGGNDKGLLLQPQALILLNYSRATWQEGVAPVIKTLGAESYTTIVSPRTGVAMDLMVKVDCGKVHIVLTATTKLVGMPNDMFHIGDKYDGRTFVNKIKVTNV